jgi:hypothetical protein
MSMYSQHPVTSRPVQVFFCLQQNVTMIDKLPVHMLLMQPFGFKEIKIKLLAVNYTLVFQNYIIHK